MVPRSDGDDATIRWLSDEQLIAWRGFVRGSALLLDRLDRELQDGHGLALPEFEVLVVLSEGPEAGIRMSVLADSALLSRSRLSHVMKRMELAGWTVRVRCEEDGRGLLARITPRGQSLVEASAVTHLSGVRRHLIDVATAADLRAVGALFASVEAALSA